MDHYGDTAVLHTDVQHNVYPAAFYAGGGVIPDMALEYIPLPDWGTHWPLNASLQQQQSCYTNEDSGLYSMPLQYGLTPHVTGNTTKQFHGLASHRPDLQVQIPLASTTPAYTRQKRKLSIDPSIDGNEIKRQRVLQDSPTYIRDNSSPYSSTASPPATSSARAHYAVEKKYRSTLNERYATLARIVTQRETMEICRTEVPDWEVPIKLEVPEEGVERHPGKRQSKTTTLSVAIETIEILDRACARKAKEFQELARRLAAIAGSASGSCNKQLTPPCANPL